MKWSNVLRIVNGKNQRAVESADGKYPIYGSGGIMGYATDYLCPEDTVIIGRKGTINKPIFAKTKFWNVDTAFGLVADKSVLFPKYLFYYCLRFDFESLNTTVTIPSLTKAHLLEIEMPVPSFSIQEQIASTLDAVSEVLRLRKAQLAELDSLVKAKFAEMFGDPVTNPKGWEQEKLENLSTLISSGNTPTGGSQVYVSNGIPFFRSQNVWRNRIDLEDIAFIDEETHRRMRKTCLKHKDILITKTGRFNTENSSLGRAALFLGKDNSANINGHVYLVRLKSGMVHEFILYIMITDEYRDYIRNVCVGGIDKRQINKEHLEEFPIILPPLELQNQFVNIFRQANLQKQSIQHSLNETQRLFDSLMSEYFE